MAEKKLTGKIARERIRLMETPRPLEGIIEGYRALGDASGIISDVMDELGVTGIVGAAVLKPTIAGSRIVGPALTVRNIVQREHVYETARQHVNKMAEFEAHNLARPGDVVVIDGVAGISNMGGISAQTGKRQGEVGAVVFGGVRDVAHSRRVGYPVWANGASRPSRSTARSWLAVFASLPVTSCSPTIRECASFHDRGRRRFWPWRSENPLPKKPNVKQLTMASVSLIFRRSRHLPEDDC